MAQRTTILTIADPTRAQLDAFKVASAVCVTDEPLEAKLAAWLKEGMMKVQMHYGVTLLAGSERVEQDGRGSNDSVRLNGNIATITAVKDGEGNAIPYVRNGHVIEPSRYTKSICIEYTTQVSPADALRYQGLAERYACARYEGLCEAEASDLVIGSRYVW